MSITDEALDHSYQLGCLLDPCFRTLVIDKMPRVSTVNPVPHLTTRPSSDSKEPNRILSYSPTIPFHQVGTDAVEAAYNLTSEGATRKFWPTADDEIDLV